MENLHILVNLVQGSKFKSKNLLDILLEPGSQMRHLFNALATNPVEREEELNYILPEISTGGTLLATLKSKLKDRLSDALICLDFNESNVLDRQKAYLDAIKKWAAATVILAKNHRQFGIEKLEQLLRHAQRFEFTEIVVDVLHTLRLQSSVVFGSETRYQEINSLLQHYLEVRRKEEHAEACYAELMLNFGSSRSNKRGMAECASTLYGQIEPYMTECSSFRLHLFGRLMEIAIYDNQNDYQSVIRLCEDAIAFFEQKPYKSFSALQVFHYTLLLSYLNQRQYKRCRAVANQYENLFVRGSDNWYKWQELFFLSELHAGDYKAAVSIWSKVNPQGKAETLSPHIGESWKIFEAYLFFLAHCCEKLKDKKIDKRFRMGKMLNEIPLAQRDKSGMNIPILIIQYLLTLAEQNFDQCIDRVDNLAKYRSRYLTLADAARSHYFFRMLELIPKANFDPLDIEFKVAPLLEKLSAIPLEAANQNFEVEVIPYETLWELTMALLKTLKAEAAKQMPKILEAEEILA